MRVLVAGCGYVGLALGARLARLGHAVDGLRRPGGEAGPMIASGIRPRFADLTSPASLREIEVEPWDWIVQCAAPSEGTEAAYRAVYVDGTRNLIDVLSRSGSPALRRLVLISSTGVYGQTDGSDVDETSPAVPADSGGRLLLEAEALVRASAGAGLRPVVLRAAGIYGPGRNRLRALRRGEARIPGEGRKWMNMIHREDLVSAIVLALERAESGAIYNLVDDRPPTGLEFYEWLSARLGRPVPPFATESTPPGRRSRAATDKRVLNGRARRELGWTPAYPDFRAGYQELLAGDPGP